jgi:hypothetical protein
MMKLSVGMSMRSFYFVVTLLTVQATASQEASGAPTRPESLFSLRRSSSTRYVIFKGMTRKRLDARIPFFGVWPVMHARAD